MFPASVHLSTNSVTTGFFFFLPVFVYERLSRVLLERNRLSPASFLQLNHFDIDVNNCFTRFLFCVTENNE